jgi:hypothetical protein
MSRRRPGFAPPTKVFCEVSFKVRVSTGRSIRRGRRRTETPAMAEQPETVKPGSTADVDRRRADRLPTSSPVRARTCTADLVGTVRDRSSGGLFLEIEGDLVFEVEFQQDERAVQRRVRLLRSQRLPGGRMGWAVEFLDPA